MSTVDLVDQTFRDGQQSLWGMRLRAGMVTGVARELDSAGFSAIDITGSSMFECVMRYSREDPWEGLDLWRRLMPRTPFRSGVGSNRIVKFGMSPDAILDLWVRTLIRHGMNSFWVYDCLYNLDQMKRLCDTIHAAGGEALGAIFYGISPVHTDEWFRRAGPRDGVLARGQRDLRRGRAGDPHRGTGPHTDPGDPRGGR